MMVTEVGSIYPSVNSTWTKRACSGLCSTKCSNGRNSAPRLSARAFSGEPWTEYWTEGVLKKIGSRKTFLTKLFTALSFGLSWAESELIWQVYHSCKTKVTTAARPNRPWDNFVKRFYISLHCYFHSYLPKINF